MDTRQFTGFTDKNEKEIYVDDILLNDFANDLWVVVQTGNMYEAWLIPNSGWIGHPDNEYPALIEELESVCDGFEVVGNTAENAEWLAHCVKPI